MSDPVHKVDILFFFELIQFLAQSFQRMQRCFSVINDSDSIQGLTVLYQVQDLPDQARLILRYRLFPDEGIFIRTGFDLCSIDEDRLP